jgi:hypothetical protein
MLVRCIECKGVFRANGRQSEVARTAMLNSGCLFHGDDLPTGLVSSRDTRRNWGEKKTPNRKHTKLRGQRDHVAGNLCLELGRRRGTRNKLR